MRIWNFCVWCYFCLVIDLILAKTLGEELLTESDCWHLVDFCLMEKKAFFTWSADSTPFANAFRTFLHYLISISYSCHAFVFYVYNTFTFWKSSQNLHKCTLADSWHRKPICDATSQKPAATRKCTFCNCLQPPPVPAAVTNNSLDFDLPIHKMASRGPRHASSTNCPEFGDQ